MKKYLILMGLVTVMASMLSSCATYKRDCQGGRHTRLANGVVI